MKHRFRLPIAVLGVALSALLASLLIYSPSRAGVLDLIKGKPAAVTATDASNPANSEAPAPSGASAVASSATAALPGQAPNYRSIVQQWGPAVVGVTVEGTRKVDIEDNEMPGTDSGRDPFFQFFHGLPRGPFQFPHPGEQPFRGQGSGFVISADGMILTNAHVVRDAQEVTVKLADRRELKAKVLGADAATDIAVLKVDASGLTAVRLGDPRTLQVGDYVLAIGAPFGFDQSATAGIVSAKGRSLPGDAYVPFIQTDAAVNPGNSGGPLFDAAGNVVGINAQIYSQTGGYQGLSFAIPIDVALHTKDQIVATGHASHARLGVMVQDLNQALAESFGLNRPDGALVSKVEPESPAAAAGLRAGDVIVQVDGNAIQRAGDLSNRIGMDSPGRHVTLKVWRDRASRDLSVKLVAAEPESAQQAANDSEGRGRLGLALRPMTTEERSAAGMDHGLVVEQSAGPAARAGIEAGDLVLGIDGEPARSVDQVKGALRSHPKSVALLIERNGQRMFVPVQLG